MFNKDMKYADISVKAMRVCESAETKEQYESAMRYAEIARDALIGVLEQRKYERIPGDKISCAFHHGVICGAKQHMKTRFEEK